MACSDDLDEDEGNLINLWLAVTSGLSNEIFLARSDFSATFRSDFKCENKKEMDSPDKLKGKSTLLSKTAFDHSVRLRFHDTKGFAYNLWFILR